MVELPYHTEFSEIPNIRVDDLVDYFNLEFGIERKSSEKKFVADDFNYIGIHKIDGFEMMLWQVRNCQFHASVQPFAETFITGMISYDN